MKPQSRRVLELLRAHREGVTQQDAIREIGCYRLAARISDLRVDGFLIRSRLDYFNGVRYARYFLTEQPVQLALDVA